MEINKWTSISVGRRFSEGFIKVGDAPQVTGKTTGPVHGMYLRTHLYVGGYDKRIYLNKGVEVNRGLDGCVSGVSCTHSRLGNRIDGFPFQLEVSSQKIDMLNSMLDGANIQNCGDTNEIAVSRWPSLDFLFKKLKMTLQPQEPVERHPSECRPGYAGDNCEVITDICLATDPCENHGICEPHGHSFICNCPIHFTGELCQLSAPVDFSSQYKGNGFVELNQTSLVPTPDENTVLIAVMFSTVAPNGLLVWYGQNKQESYTGQDFLALAVVDGYLEFSFRLNSEEALVRNTNKRVDDGIRHIAVIKRDRNQGSLELDKDTLFGESRPTDREFSHLPGGVFIGGAPDIANFTGNRYKQGLFGCINVVEGTDTGPVKLRDNAVSGYNVVPCQE